MYDAGYEYQEITWTMMNRNLKFIQDNPDARARMPENLGKESRDLDDIKKKNISDKDIYMGWKEAIKKR